MPLSLVLAFLFSSRSLYRAWRERNRFFSSRSFLSLFWSMAAGVLSRTLSEAASHAAAEMQAAEEKVCFVFLTDDLSSMEKKKKRGKLVFPINRIYSSLTFLSLPPTYNRASAS